MVIICISHRCGLCGFKLHKGDSKVAITKEGVQLEVTLSDAGPMKDGSGKPILQCTDFGRCRHRGRSTGCHSACAGPLAAESPSSRAALLEVLEYRFEPLPSEMVRRMRWLRQRFASSLERAKPSLPLEIRLEIAEHLPGSDLHRLVMAPAVRVLPNCFQERTFHVSMSEEIWARFVSFEGIQYISSLSNSRDDHHSESIFAPDPSRSVKFMHIARSQLGITQVMFAGSSQDAVFEDGQGQWWEYVELAKPNPMLVIKTDGVKLRTIVTEDKIVSVAFRRHILWSTPRKASIRPIKFEPGLYPNQLLALKYNMPEAIGYSMCWSKRIKYLHAHLLQEDFAFYEVCQEGMWVHFPTSRGEKITEIWTQRLHEGRLLILKTSCGRTWFMGTCTQTTSPPLLQPQLIDLPPQDEESRTFFEYSVPGVLNFVFETPVPDSSSRSPPVRPEPLSPNPRLDSKDQAYFFSSANLDGVVKIIPCRRYVRDRRRVVGLLLEYTDGRRTCVGQVRLDSLDKPLLVGGSRHMYLGFSQDDQGPNASAVELSRPHIEQSDTSWMEIGLCGDLEWWFTTKQCRIWHEGKSSPPTRAARGWP